jgi:hypothetical protein
LSKKSQKTQKSISWRSSAHRIKVISQPYYRRPDSLTIRAIGLNFGPTSGPTKSTEPGIMPILGQQYVHLKQPSPLDSNPLGENLGNLGTQPVARGACFFCVCRCFYIPLFPLFPFLLFSPWRFQTEAMQSTRASGRDENKTALGSYHLLFSDIPNFIYPWGRADRNRTRNQNRIENIVWHLEEIGMQCFVFYTHTQA